MSESLPLLGSTNTMSKWWRIGASFVAIGMITGAFGTHGLKKREGITLDRLHAWETAAHYAIFNGLALMLISLHPRFAMHKYAGPAISVGGAVFSVSIFALVLGRGTLKFLGILTPLGGTLAIAGYIALAL